MKTEELDIKRGVLFLQILQTLQKKAVAIVAADLGTGRLAVKDEHGRESFHFVLASEQGRIVVQPQALPVPVDAGLGLADDGVFVSIIMHVGARIAGIFLGLVWFGSVPCFCYRSSQLSLCLEKMKLFLSLFFFFPKKLFLLLLLLQLSVSASASLVTQLNI